MTALQRILAAFVLLLVGIVLSPLRAVAATVPVLMAFDAAGLPTATRHVETYGINGGPLNAAGLSVRAETQVSALNRAAGGRVTYESSIVQMIPRGAGARGAALSLERQLVYGYLDLSGRKPLGNLLP